MYKIYSDAAIKPNKNQCGLGVLILDGTTQYQFKQTNKAQSNHEAEFMSCILAFHSVIDLLASRKQSASTTTILYYTDSKILAESIDKKYAKHYQDFVNQISNLIDQFRLVTVKWIPDRKNKGAHELAYQALHSN